MTATVDKMFSHDLMQPGRWWLTARHGLETARRIDDLAAMAQKQWPERVAVLDSSAMLISNLQVWENLILPVWQRDNASLVVLEDQVSNLCELAGMPEVQRERLLGYLPATLDRSSRRLAVLLRSVLIEPACVILEDEFWRDMSTHAAETPQARLFARLQKVPCCVVVGASAKAADFVSVDVLE